MQARIDSPPLYSRLVAPAIRFAVRTASQGCYRPLIPLCAGFVLGCILPAGFVGVAAFVAAATALLVGAVLFGALPRSGQGVIAALCGLLLIGFGLGCGRSRIVQARLAVNPLTQALSQIQGGKLTRPAILSGTVASSLHETPRGAWLLLDVSQFSIGESRGGIDASETKPRVFVSLPAGALQRSPSRPQLGDAMLAEGLLSPVKSEVAQDSAGGWANWLRTQGVSGALSVRQSVGSVKFTPLEGLTLTTLGPRLADKCHLYCDAQLRAALPASTAALIEGILLGERSSLTPAQTSAFAAAGCAHLLATAGLHVGILALVLEAALRRLTVPRKLSALLLIGIVWLYALTAGDRAAVERAAGVATLYYGAILLERTPDLLSSLALCALVMLWGNPLMGQDAGFQLSFGTVLGLIVAMPVAMQSVEGWTAKIRSPKLRHAARRIIEVECLAFAAQAVSAPLVAAQFNQVSCWGVFANFLACPLMFIIVPAALLSFAAGAINGAVGLACLRGFVGPLVQALFGIVSWFSAQPGCSAAVPTPSIGMIALYYALLFAVCILLRPHQLHEARAPNSAPTGDPAPASGDSAGGTVVAAVAKPL